MRRVYNTRLRNASLDMKIVDAALISE